MLIDVCYLPLLFLSRKNVTERQQRFWSRVHGMDFPLALTVKLDSGHGMEWWGVNG